MADQFKKLSDIDYSTVTKDKLNSYYRAAVEKFGKGSKEASEYGKAMAKAYQVNKGVMPKDKSPAKKPAAKKTTKATSSTQQAKKPAKPAPVQRKNKHANTGSGRDGSSGTGTYGKNLPSNPKLKSQPKRNQTGRASMPYAGKFPGEPDKNDKRSKFPKFFK